MRKDSLAENIAKCRENEPKDKVAAPNISQRLSYLFNESLRIGQFPSVCETARVTLHFQEGSPTDCDNYRPISVLPCISKIMESFVNTDL